MRMILSGGWSYNSPQGCQSLFGGRTVAEPIKNSPNKPDDERAKMMRVLIPAGAIALIVILVAVIASMSGTDKKMSDGSNGVADDPDLKDITTGVKYRDLKVGEGEACTPGAK